MAKVKEDHVFTINKDRESDTEELQYKVLDINGSTLSNHKDLNGVAKAVYDPNADNYTYFVKVSTAGRDKQKLFNPQGMYAVSVDARNLETGKQHYQYQKVSRKCYDRYVEFINTKNSLSLRHAQREADY